MAGLLPAKRFEAIGMRDQTTKLRSGAAVLGVVLVLAGCHKGAQAFQSGAKTETVQDYTAQNYDEDVRSSDQTLKKNPKDAHSKMNNYQVRFEASQLHVKRGIDFLQQQQNQQALVEFQTALAIDPSSMVARQE